LLRGVLGKRGWSVTAARERRDCHSKSKRKRLSIDQKRGGKEGDEQRKRPNNRSGGVTQKILRSEKRKSRKRVQAGSRNYSPRPKKNKGPASKGKKRIEKETDRLDDVHDHVSRTPDESTNQQKL